LTEKIDRAAIVVGDTVYSVTRPARHGHVLALIRKVKKNFDWVGTEDQGFLTTQQRFVDRFEGADIAIRTGQIPKLNWPPQLYSEDLW
jgi:hypothetical protein